MIQKLDPNKAHSKDMISIRDDDMRLLTSDVTHVMPYISI